MAHKRPREKGHEDASAEDQDPEVLHTMRLATRHEENYEKKQHLFSGLPSTDIYGLSLTPPSEKKTRRDVKVLTDILTPIKAEAPLNDPVATREIVAKLSAPVKSGAWHASDPALVARAKAETGAQRIIAPHTAPIRPMHQFFADNLAALSLSQKRVKEAETAATAASATDNAPLASAGGRTPKRGEGKERTTLPMGKRSNTLQPAAVAPASSGLPPLPAPPDPAAQSLERMHLISGMIIKYLDEVRRYHELKAQFGPRKLPTPYEMSPEHVGWSHSKFFPPYTPCVFQMRCEGYTQTYRHDNGERFPFVQYVPPLVRAYVERTGCLPMPTPGASPDSYLQLDDVGRPLPTPCLRCMVKILLYLCYQNIGDDQLANKIPVPFFHPVGRPGAYDPSAVISFSDGRVNGITTPLRLFAPEQFVPCQREVISVRQELDGRSRSLKITVLGYEEKDSVKYFDAARTNQRRALEADERAVGPSSVPPVPPLPGTAARAPSVYPTTTIVRGPTSATAVLRSSLLLPGSSEPLDLSTATLKEAPLAEDAAKTSATVAPVAARAPLAARRPDWTATVVAFEKLTDIVKERVARVESLAAAAAVAHPDEPMLSDEEPADEDAANEDATNDTPSDMISEPTVAVDSVPAAAVVQSKNGPARRRNTHLAASRPEGGDAHIIHSSLLSIPLVLGERLEGIPAPANPCTARLELTFRPIEDAYRLAVYWLRTLHQEPRTLSFIDTPATSYRRFDLAQGPLDMAQLSNLLHHLLCIRIDACFELEELFFSKIGARRSWLFARSLAAPGASSASINGKKRRKKGAEPSMAGLAGAANGISQTMAPLSSVLAKALLEETSPQYREQLGTQIVYWRDLHAPLIAELWKDDETEAVIVAPIDPENLVPRAYRAAVLQDPSTLGLAPPLFAAAASDPSRPMPPIYDKDIEQLRMKTVLRCHETPLTFLRKRLPYYRADSSLQELLDTSVLVDFRQTIAWLSRSEGPAAVTVPTNKWMPDAMSDSDTLYVEKHAHAVERHAWVEKMCEHIRKKDTSADGRARADALRYECQKRTEAITAAFTEGAAARAAQKAQRRAANELFASVLCSKNGWQAAPLGVDASSNYLVLVAVVYRVNHALIQMDAERARLEALEQELKRRFDRPAARESSHSVHRDDDEDDGDDDDDEEDNEGGETGEESTFENSASQEALGSRGRASQRRTSEQDDDDTVQQFMKRYRRAQARMMRSVYEPSAEERNLLADIEYAKDIVHAWKRFAFSHLPLAQAIVDAPRFDDARLMEEKLSEQRLSIYTVLYPFPDNGWGEETLQNTRHRAHLVDMVYGIGGGGSTGTIPSRPAGSGGITSAGGGGAPRKKSNRGEADTGRKHEEEEQNRDDGDAGGSAANDANPWIALLKKTFLKACSDRDFAERCDAICRANIRCFHYVLECLTATLAGVYRHCNNPVRFSLALSLHRLQELCHSSEAHRSLMLDVIFGNEEVVINALRENISLQSADDPNLWMINTEWVKGCTHVIRTIFNRKGTLDGVNDAIVRCYGFHGLLSGTKSLPASMAMSVGDGGAGASGGTGGVTVGTGGTLLVPGKPPIALGKPSVYRVNNKNFVKYMSGLVRSMAIEAVLAAVIASASHNKGEPRVYRLSNDAFDMVLHVVETTRPGESVRLAWFRMIGVSEDGVNLLMTAYDLFRRRAHENEIKHVIREFKALDFELISLFFHLLRRHSDHRLILLDAATAREQELAVRHRMCVPVTDAHPPQHIVNALLCSIAACNELKNYVVGRTREPLFCGFLRIAWEDDRKSFICTSKKTILVRARNEDRRRSRSALSSTEPVYMRSLRAGDTSGFYGCYEPVSNLVRLPPGTHGASAHNNAPGTTGDAQDHAMALDDDIDDDSISDIEEDDDDDDEDGADGLEDDEDAAMGLAENGEPVPGKLARNKRRDGGRRENLEHSFVPEITESLHAYANQLRVLGIDPTPHVLYSLDYAPKELFSKLSDKEVHLIEQRRSDLDVECKKEERRIFRIKTERPCFEVPVFQVPLCGYVLEKDSTKNKNTSVAATLCRCCGATFDFSLRLAYANGITCGFCDYAERRLLYAPRCFVCRRSHLERCSAGQGLFDVQRDQGGKLRLHVLLDDTTDWMPRAVRVCDGCWYDWMHNEARFMTMSDMLRHLYKPTRASLAYVPVNQRGGTSVRAMRKGRWCKRETLDTYIKEDSWPSKQFVEAISAKTGISAGALATEVRGQSRDAVMPNSLAAPKKHTSIEVRISKSITALKRQFKETTSIAGARGTGNNMDMRGGGKGGEGGL